MTPPIPSDGNYSTWMPFLDSQIDKFCKDGMTFSMPSGRLGTYLFPGMSTQSQADALTSFMVGDTGMGDYILSKGGVLAFLIVGLVVMIVCIVMAFTVLPDFRKKVSKWCCCNKGWCMDRDRVRFEDVPSGWKILMIGGSIVFAVGCLVTSIFLIIDTVQVLKAGNATYCNTWMQMRGHFFGVEDYDRGNVEGIAWDWKGTMTQYQELADIQAQVEPGDNNPLLISITNSYHDLQNEINPKANDTAMWADGMKANMSAILGITKQLNNTAAGGDPLFTHKLWLAQVAIDKTQEYNDVLMQSISDGYAAIEQTIDKYLGPNSSLLKEGYDVSVNALRSLKDVNGAIAQLIDTFDYLGGLLNILIKLMISLSFIVAILSIIMGLVTVGLVSKLFHSFKHDELPSKTTRKLLSFTYVFWMFMGGTSAFFCGLTFLVGSIGWDACNMAEEALFTDGNWNILGYTILHSVKNSSVDLWQILDTCVRADGDGDVAGALQINGLLSTLEASVAEASADINSLTDRVLDPPDKIVRSRLLIVGYDDTLSFLYQPEKTNDDANGYFNDTHYVRPEVENPDTYFGTWELLCLAPVYGFDNSVVMEVCKQDLVFRVSSQDQAVTALNERVVPVVQAAGIEFPSSFCSDIVSKAGMCAKPEEATLINYNSVTNGDLDKWVKAVQDAKPSDTALPSRFKVAATSVALNEGIQNIPLRGLVEADGSSSTSWVTCPNSESLDGCTFGEYKDALHEEFKSESPRFLDDTNWLLDTCTAFVADPVMTTMNSLVGDAKSALQHFNCQFIGTSLHSGSVGAMCESMMPGVAMQALLFGCHFIVCMIAAWGVWKNFHYVNDLCGKFVPEIEDHYYVESQTKSKDNKKVLQDEALKTIYGSQSIATVATSDLKGATGNTSTSAASSPKMNRILSTDLDR